MEDEGIGKRKVKDGIEKVDFRIGRIWKVNKDNLVEENIGRSNRKNGMRDGRKDENIVKIKKRKKN